MGTADLKMAQIANGQASGLATLPAMFSMSPVKKRAFRLCKRIPWQQSLVETFGKHA